MDLLKTLALIGCGLAAAVAAAPAQAADAYASDWAPSLKSSARLIAGAGADGRPVVAVEIRLAPGAITYWRNPGESGLPPSASFDGSANLARATLAYPAPSRLDAHGAEAFGYANSVILPIAFVAQDPSRPVTLALALNYAVCEKICVPARARLSLSLSAETTSGPFSSVIAQALARAPRPVAWSSLAPTSSLARLDPSTWRLCVAGEAGAARDIFIEAPESWWFDAAPASAASGSAHGPACFTLTLRQKPDDSHWPVDARITITGGGGPIETVVPLGAQS
jgi:DsbC/DsbD-like thiol-disulfide interchange protein